MVSLVGLALGSKLVAVPLGRNRLYQGLFQNVFMFAMLGTE
jgi:hypothetical protein